MSDEAKAAAERLLKNWYDSYGETAEGCPRSRDDAVIVASVYLALSAAPTLDALKTAGDICERLKWNPDIIPELAKELVTYAAGLRTPAMDAEGFDGVFFIRNLLSQGGAIQLDHADKDYETYSRRLDIAAVERYAELKPHLRTPERDAEIRREAIELCAKRIEDGYFLHDQAPTALFAKEAAKAIRSLT